MPDSDMRECHEPHGINDLYCFTCHEWAGRHLIPCSACGRPIGRYCCAIWFDDCDYNSAEMCGECFQKHVCQGMPLVARTVAGYLSYASSQQRFRGWSIDVYNERMPTEASSEGTITYPPFICSQGLCHCPRSKPRQQQLKQWMFSAVFDGCLPCVQHCIEVLGVSPQVQSDNMRYTAIMWAQYGMEKHRPGAAAVHAYLGSRLAQPGS